MFNFADKTKAVIATPVVRKAAYDFRVGIIRKSVPSNTYKSDGSVIRTPKCPRCDTPVNVDGVICDSCQDTDHMILDHLAHKRIDKGE